MVGAIIASLGVAAAIFTFILSAKATRRANLKQHTITILLDTRLSTEFRETLEKRRKVFPEYQDISVATWNASRKAMTGTWIAGQWVSAEDRRAAANALSTLLNYYEFLALGIRQGDLDEDMLRETIRGIMCNLVDDARFVVAELRHQSHLTYKNLIWLYSNWRREGAKDINGNPNERPIPS